MRKAITIIITILTCITAFITVIIFSTNYIVSEKSTTKIIKTINPKRILEEINTTNHVDSLYQEASFYNISKEQVDMVLASDEFSDYLNQITQEVIKNKLNNTTISILDIEKITDTFIQEASVKYQLNISQSNKEELKSITSNAVTKEANDLIQTVNNQESNALIDFVRFCTTSSIKNIPNYNSNNRKYPNHNPILA